ncbi:hypothetical protein RHGRI_023008 [Rhododendron griersonianum]|uniref:TF-B3 domain-containing protein n=1 Tax=Rhododendron griersonianum TaxID=479676 RepID=A0AAV6J7F0_9ERIC|nr:hypothetical protein RHGRI_023008 [Rhododendron griersonianum]
MESWKNDPSTKIFEFELLYQFTFVQILRSVLIQQIFFGILQYLPTKFAKENLSEKPEKVVLQGANGGVWPVKCHYGGRSRYFLYWKSFVQANNVKANDVCVFELIKSIEPRLNVVIFRN